MRNVHIIGVPLDLGGGRRGVDMGPSALRIAGIGEKLAALALASKLPAISFRREFADAGGLFSYGPVFADGYRQAGIYAGRILKGAKPSELPVMQPIKFELVVNLRTAKAMGLTIPEAFLLRADEVIE